MFVEQYKPSLNSGKTGPIMSILLFWANKYQQVLKNN